MASRRAASKPATVAGAEIAKDAPAVEADAVTEGTKPAVEASAEAAPLSSSADSEGAVEAPVEAEDGNKNASPKQSGGRVNAVVLSAMYGQSVDGLVVPALRGAVISVSREDLERGISLGALREA